MYMTGTLARYTKVLITIINKLPIIKTNVSMATPSSQTFTSSSCSALNFLFRYLLNFTIIYPLSSDLCPLASIFYPLSFILHLLSSIVYPLSLPIIFYSLFSILQSL